MEAVKSTDGRETPVRISVCGVGCEKCPRRVNDRCPNGADGCKPRLNQFCKICTCAFERGERWCFSCALFPCELTKTGPVQYGYCTYIAAVDGFDQN